MAKRMLAVTAVAAFSGKQRIKEAVITVFTDNGTTDNNTRAL